MVDPLKAITASVLLRMRFDGIIFMALAVIPFMSAVNAISPVCQLDVARMVSCCLLFDTFDDEICADGKCDQKDTE
jgi:hypothetical protein